MKMTRSREIIAAFLQCVIAFSTAVLLFSFFMNFTFASPSYIASRFPSGEVAAQCDEQLTKKYTALSRESGFPLRVFEMVKEDMPTVQSVNASVKGLVEGENVDFYNQNQIDYFYNLCEEYAKGNNLDYSKADLKATAQRAAQIYSETAGVKNADSAVQKIADLKHRVTLAQFMSAVLLAACGTAVMLMYSRKRLGWAKLLTATAGGGIGVLLSSGILYLIKPAQNLDIAPAVYAQGFGEMSKGYFVITALVSVAVIAASYITMIQQELKYERNKDKVKIT